MRINLSRNLGGKDEVRMVSGNEDGEWFGFISNLIHRAHTSDYLDIAQNGN